jgi:D-alanyl-D-alanine carboxypeptidase/D-alanyl-D-alanine-endopeptidase (penicillin-binding protein 4)
MKFQSLIIIPFLWGITLQVHADDGSEVKRKAESIISKSDLKRSDLGILIKNSQGATLYSLNSEKHFIPASISKLLTTAAVVSELQPDFRFKTQIFIDGSITDGVLKGNIYLKGGGDPAFVSEKMWMLVDDFKREQIKKITGKIIVDDTYFDDERVDKGRESERNDRAYDAPVGALSFNWNSTTIYVRPSPNIGEKALVFIDPENKYVTLENKVTTSKSGTDVSANRVEQTGHDTIVVSGHIAIGAPEKHIFKNISDPPLYAGNCFREFLHQRQIEVDGEIKRGVVPSDARLVTEQKSEPISRLITDMNKFSNNYVAEMLAKDLGAVKTSSQGHMKDGVQQVRNFLVHKLKFASDDFNLVNVSGFTRKNSFTPEQFVSLLDWIQKQFTIYPEILQSLPIAGIDGTLEKRMKDTNAVRWVRAKTGLLNGVVALAGYAGGLSGVDLFTFIYNGHADESHVRNTFDALAASLVK